MKRDRAGVTLTEMMITVAILGLVVTLGPTVLKNITKFTRLSTAQLETQRGARDALTQINRNLRQASAASVIVSQETGQPPYSSVSFTAEDGRQLKYYQNNQSLYVVSNGSTATLSGGLRVISFAYPRTDDPTIMSVSVTFEKDTYEGGSKALQMAIEKVRIMND